MSYGYGIAEADFLRGMEDGSHVVIPFLYHMENFPNFINIGWGVSVSEPKFTSDDIKSAFIHQFHQDTGAWICLLIKGGDTPKILPHPSIAGGN